MPNDLEGVDACISPGVNEIAGFELECAERGMQVFMADASVDKPPTSHSHFTFVRKYIGATSQGDFIRFEDWVDTRSPNSMGIYCCRWISRVGEYEALLSMPSDIQNRFRIMVIEFHYLDYLFSDPWFSLCSRVFEGYGKPMHVFTFIQTMCVL